MDLDPYELAVELAERQARQERLIPCCEVCRRIIPLVEAQSEEILKLSELAEIGALWRAIALWELFLSGVLALYALLG